MLSLRREAARIRGGSRVPRAVIEECLDQLYGSQTFGRPSLVRGGA
jgi:hypothetical protein